jgi:Lrp/AsnC family transcriptional regulator, leucine-responsive regulatory protein
MKPIDRIDRRILSELQKDGRLSNVDLAAKVGLTASPCLERVKRLESEGYIEGYFAKLNSEALGYGLVVFVEIQLVRTSADVFDEFKLAVQSLDAIQECHLVSGDFDYLLKARVGDMKQYRRLLGETLLKLPKVSASKSYVVMEEVKDEMLIAVEQ